MSEIDDLHHALFKFRPKKHGTAYERVTAVVLAALGWTDIKHDRHERATGKLALHQLDVTAREPGGKIERLIVECKDLEKKLGKGTMDQLVGVLAQLGLRHGMAVTTVDFTKGAIKVAVDNDLALVRIRPYDPTVTYVAKVEVQFTMEVPSRSPLDPLPLPGEILPRDAGTVSPFDVLLHLDGSEAELVSEVLQQHVQPIEGDSQERIATFGDGRLLERDEGQDPLRLGGLRWKETLHHHTERVTVGSESEPRLIVEQLDETGKPEDGRVMVDDKLFAWDIDPEGNIKPRRQLPATHASG
jgi:Restriction endonuclease